MSELLIKKSNPVISRIQAMQGNVYVPEDELSSSYNIKILCGSVFLLYGSQNLWEGGVQSNKLGDEVGWEAESGPSRAAALLSSRELPGSASTGY